jgi:hypothetical protein
MRCKAGHLESADPSLQTFCVCVAMVIVGHSCGRCACHEAEGGLLTSGTISSLPCTFML